LDTITFAVRIMKYHSVAYNRISYFLTSKGVICFRIRELAVMVSA
jgi:hypothetical protein